MRVIPITPRKPGQPAPVNVSRLSVLSVGHTRSGKTRFAATWPRPLVLADVTEEGWTTIETMDPSLYYEPDVVPMVWGIETVADFHKGVEDARNLVAQGKIKTIIVSSLTFLADLQLNTIINNFGPGDNYKIYGQLGVDLRNWRVKVGGLNCHVIWETLIQSPDKEHPIPRLAIPGAQGAKFGAGCSYILEFTRSVDANGVATHAILTRSMIAGGRDSGALPPVLPVPTYRGLVACLQQRKAAENVITDPAAIQAAAEAMPKNVPVPGARRTFAAPVKK